MLIFCGSLASIAGRKQIVLGLLLEDGFSERWPGATAILWGVSRLDFLFRVGVNGWDFLEAETSINGEVRLIGGNDCREREQLGHNNQRGIAGIHLGIFDHQFLCSFKLLGPRAEKLDGALADKGKQRMGRAGVCSQIPAGFPQNDFARVQRSANPGQHRNTPLVPLVAGVEPSDQRSRVNERANLHSLPSMRDLWGH